MCCCGHVEYCLCHFHWMKPWITIMHFLKCHVSFELFMRWVGRLQCTQMCLQSFLRIVHDISWKVAVHTNVFTRFPLNCSWDEQEGCSAHKCVYKVSFELFMKWVGRLHSTQMCLQGFEFQGLKLTLRGKEGWSTWCAKIRHVLDSIAYVH